MTRGGGPIIVGLTGSIAMGKSQAADNFRRLGVPVFDADAEVHELLARGGAAVQPVEAAFPGVARDGAVDRGALGARVFGDPDALKRLERIVHPLVGIARRRFLHRARANRAPLVVLDIPLLLEGGGEKSCDYVVVVSAPARVQRARAMQRPGMTDEKFAGILARQMPDADKRRRADFVIPTGLDRGFSLRRIREIVRMIRRSQKPKRRRRPA